MHRYFTKTPWWLKKWFHHYVWHIPVESKAIFLTFDDGPHPAITPWVLELLKQYNASATFFCIGNNVEKYPDVFARILKEGHAVGNHTHHHLNGWKTDTQAYLNNVAKAAGLIESNLFRPPYGRIKSSQAKGIKKAMKKPNAQVIMWDVLSGDFDSSITVATCIKNVVNNVAPGSIVVFHDSEKAFAILEKALPEIIKTLTHAGYKFEKIVM